MIGLRIGSLFTGYGGLDMAVEEVTGGRTVWVSEYEPPTKKNPRPTQAAARLLAYRHPDVPNLGDVSAIDWAGVPRVDVLTGGFPCQGLSLAGKRLGLLDARSGLWERMAYAVDQLRPSLVVIENVRGLLSAEAGGSLESCPWCVGDPDHVPLRALGAVLGDLADLGYDARWIGLRAADVGAPHGRFRVFVVAWPAADADDVGRRRRAGFVGSGRRGQPEDGRSVAADTGSARPQGPAERARPGARREAEDDGGRRTAGRARAATADADGGPVRDTAVPEFRSIGAAVTGDPHPVASDADGDRLGGVGRIVTVGRDADGCGRADRNGHPAESEARPAVADAQSCGGPDVAEGAHPAALVGSESGAGAGDRPGGTAAGAVLLGGVAGVQWGEFETAVRRWETMTRPAPAPTEQDWEGWQRRRAAALRRRRSRVQPVGHRGSVWGLWNPPAHRLSPEFVEWMMGLPEGWVTAVPGLNRREALRMLGNGVVPQQAAAAVRVLLSGAV